MYAPHSTVLRVLQGEADRVLPPVTSFVQSTSYRELLEAELEGGMEEDERGVEEGRTRESDARTMESNRNFEWAQNDNQRYNQNYILNSSPGSGGHWPDVVPNEGQPPPLLGHGVITNNGYPLTYVGVNDSQWDYERSANNQLLLTNSGMNANMVHDDHPTGLTRAPPDVNIAPQRAMGRAPPANRRCRGHRGGRQREKTPPFESDHERRQWEKERRKKDIHNKIEQRRRYNINDRIDDLGKLLRKGGHEIRHNKGAILRETIAYIRALRAYLSGLEKMEERAEELNRTNETILLRIQRMQNFIQSRGYSPSNDLSSRPPQPSVDLHDWTNAAADHLPVYPDMTETPPVRGNSALSLPPYPEVPVKQESSSGNLTPLYSPTTAGVVGGTAEELPSACDIHPPGYYQMYGHYSF